MDFTDALKAGGASATIISIFAIVYKVVVNVCNHRVKSECCGKEGTMAISVAEISPPHAKPHAATEVAVVPADIIVEIPEVPVISSSSF
jgi:hypothetical protein